MVVSNTFWWNAERFERFEGPDDFLIAHFEAEYHGGTVSDFKSYGLIAGLAVTTARTWVMKKSGKQIVPFCGNFFTSAIFLTYL